MSPKSHNRLFTIVSLIAIVVAIPLGLLSGAQFGGPAWQVGGLVVGMMLASILSRVLFRHLVPVNCPECGDRMRCRVRSVGRTFVAEYTCCGCAHFVSPSLDFSKRLFERILDQVSKK